MTDFFYLVIRRLKGKFLYQALPKIVDLLTALSLKRPSKILKAANVRRLLIDNTLLAHGVTHETAWISTETIPWGDDEIVSGYRARIPVHSDDDQSEIARSVRYLPAIAYLAKHDHVTLAISDELLDEQWTQPAGRFRGYGIFDFSLFSGLDLEIINDPDYSFYMLPSWLGGESLKEQRKRRLESKTDSLYRSLVDILGPNNSQDAWHIVTAERYECYCFLTMDFKLIRNMQAQSKNPIIRSLKTKVMSPEEFGKLFDIIPLPLRIYSYHDANGPVKNDTNWADSKRQKPFKK